MEYDEVRSSWGGTTVTYHLSGRAATSTLLLTPLNEQLQEAYDMLLEACWTPDELAAHIVTAGADITKRVVALVVALGGLEGECQDLD